MSPHIKFFWPKYQLFPYERRLGRREICALLGGDPVPFAGGFRLAGRGAPNGELDRLTYFERISVDADTFVPLQARLEATANGARAAASTPRRQSTRYSAHGIHEYRGKFNPQIVRAVGNILRLPENASVLDPFCGSGTTVLECSHIGWDALGLDLNPLAVFITRTKLEAMRLDPTVLERLASRLIERLRTVASRLRLDRPFSAREHRLLAADLRLPNQEYLARWFAPSVLTQLARVEFEARRLRDPVVANTVRLVLSDLLRSVSLQDPGDLRIRRRKDAKDNYPAIPRFAELLERRVRAIASARRVLGNIRGVQEVARADVRVALGPQLKHLRAQDMFDAVITSPPYATALPYIDTQRLSLAFLGLASEAELRSLERALIGNREIGKRERDHDVQLIGSDGGILPTRVLRLCRRALRLLQKGPDGFRRQNTPALLFRYFKDMALAFANIRPLVKPGGRLAFVVGPNRTTLGGRPLTIDTPRLLLEVAEHVGWRRVELVSLDAYQRYDVHQRNSIRAETLVILCRPT